MTSRLVYSTETGRLAPPKAKADTKRKPAGPPVPNAPDDGWVRLWRIKGGRGGKTVTVITGIGAAEVGNLAAELRRFAGSGGNVRDSVIEIHGDHRERLQKHLADLGYRVKLAGG
jgi:translation initiation factor 1